MAEPTKYPDSPGITRDPSSPMPGREASGIEQALTYAQDRLERLSVQVEQLALQLRPVVAQYDERKPLPNDLAGIPAVSPVGERIVGFGHQADRLADQLSELQSLVEL